MLAGWERPAGFRFSISRRAAWRGRNHPPDTLAVLG
jgi:hypothetical protein